MFVVCNVIVSLQRVVFSKLIKKLEGLESGKSWSSNCFQALKFTHFLYSEENTNFTQLIYKEHSLIKESQESLPYGLQCSA